MELMVTIPYIIKSIKRAKMRERLRVAVQKKGRLYDNSMELFNKIGIKVEFSSKSNLLCHSINAPIDFSFCER